MRTRLLLCACLFAGNCFASTLPPDLQALVGKQVVVGRLPLCTPHTVHADASFMGKAATVLSAVPPSTHVQESFLRTMPPTTAAQIRDLERGALMTFDFAGTRLDTCLAIGRAQLEAEIEVAPGQTFASPGPAASAPVDTAAPPGPALPCPIAFENVVSGSGGFRHAVAEALTTSEFQRQLDEVSHEGVGKHFLDFRYRNVGTQPIRVVEFDAVFSDRMGDESGKATFMTQDAKPLAPGESRFGSAMDRAQFAANGAGDVTVIARRVRFVDGTLWRDDGTGTCKATGVVK